MDLNLKKSKLNLGGGGSKLATPFLEINIGGLTSLA